MSENCKYHPEHTEKPNTEIAITYCKIPSNECPHGNSRPISWTGGNEKGGNVCLSNGLAKTVHSDRNYQIRLDNKTYPTGSEGVEIKKTDEIMLGRKYRPF